jgi:hypothetical protein
VCGAQPENELWFVTGFRYIPEKGPNGRWTTSVEMHYKNLTLGVDYRPLTKRAGVIASVRLLEETKTRPSIVIGTGPDQFGRIYSQAYFATVSKRVAKVGGVSVLPFIGAGYIEAMDETKFIRGIILRREAASLQLFNNGFATHFVASYDFLERHSISFVLWGMEQPGFSYTVRF